MGIDPVFLEQLAVGAFLCNLAVLNNQNTIAVDDGRESMGDDNHRSVVLAEEIVNGFLNLVLTLGIEGRCCLIKDHDFRLFCKASS
jgi:hypothetical protein